MALSINNYLKQTATPSIMASASYMANASRIIRVWPNTEPFPSATPASFNLLPAGHMLELTSTHFTIGPSSNSIIFTGGTLVANTLAAGTFGWFAFGVTSTSTQFFISDAVSTSGGTGVLIVSNMSPGNGDAVTVGFNLSFY